MVDISLNPSNNVPTSLNEVQVECSGWDLVLGHATGVRGWSLDKHGRLVGMSYPVVWTPGVNTAICARATDEYVRYSGRVRLAHSGRGPCKDISECRNGCGFYAYHDGCMDYTFRGLPSVTGVIKGTGKTIVGTRGFRSTQAEIVALCVKPRAAWSQAGHDEPNTTVGADVVEWFAFWRRAKIARELERLYGVPVYLSERRMLRNHPVDRELHPVNLMKQQAAGNPDSDFWRIT